MSMYVSQYLTLHVRGDLFIQRSFPPGKAPVEKETGAALSVQWEKMSKSKYNGVDPQVRAGMVFMCSFQCGDDRN